MFGVVYVDDGILILPFKKHIDKELKALQTGVQHFR
jgi:hypothetical protein